MKCISGIFLATIFLQRLQTFISVMFLTFLNVLFLSERFFFKSMLQTMIGLPGRESIRL